MREPWVGHPCFKPMWNYWTLILSTGTTLIISSPTLMFEILTYLYVVQTIGQTPQSTGRWRPQPRSPSWCCLCTSPPPTCTDHLHWPRLEAKRAVSAKILWGQKWNQIEIILGLCRTYALQSTPSAYNRRRSRSPGPYYRRSGKHRSGWSQYQTGTSGCFSPTGKYRSSLTPSQSTRL